MDDNAGAKPPCHPPPADDAAPVPDAAITLNTALLGPLTVVDGVGRAAALA
ncbi:MAG TPA: hypothetical protein VFE12_21475 [Acetobacteraceae bacterium]|nr:hypothetical protein [Acetobacteraceae bacterium]